MAHACCGHNSFFKGNYLFRMWTDASWRRLRLDAGIVNESPVGDREAQEGR